MLPRQHNGMVKKAQSWNQYNFTKIYCSETIYIH